MGMSLSELLAEAQERIRDAYEQRDQVLKAMRRVTKVAKRAIFAVHKGELQKARGMLDEAREELMRLKAFLMERPEIAGLGILGPAFQEYSEAEAFLALVSGSKVPSPDELGVPPDQFVLGLADVIGELRRRALDALKEGRLPDAEACLELMEELYMELISLDEAQAILSDLRHKCDIARRIIEATRGDITVEARRMALEKALSRLEGLLRRSGGEGAES